MSVFYSFIKDFSSLKALANFLKISDLGSLISSIVAAVKASFYEFVLMTLFFSNSEI